MGALPRASPAACQAPRGGPDSRNLNDALRKRPDPSEEVRDIVGLRPSDGVRWGGSMGEYAVFAGLSSMFDVYIES